MRAHQLKNNVIDNTIVVNSLQDIPNLVDASIGGIIGDSIINGVVIKKAIDISSEKAYFVKKVDLDADEIYSLAIGSRLSEYQQAEIDAINYKASGYSGTPASSVHDWAVAKGETDQWAADNILMSAAGWRSAQAAIRKYRLASKESARTAQTIEELDTIKSQWQTFVLNIKRQLGIS